VCTHLKTAIAFNIPVRYIGLLEKSYTKLTS
jgi:hypothetical protein